MAHYVNIPREEMGDYAFAKDASELGLKPGHWPAEIVVNQSLFFKRDGYTLNDDDELGGYTYRARLKHGEMRMLVAND